LEGTPDVFILDFMKRRSQVGDAYKTNPAALACYPRLQRSTTPLCQCGDNWHESADSESGWRGRRHQVPVVLLLLLLVCPPSTATRSTTRIRIHWDWQCLLRTEVQLLVTLQPQPSTSIWQSATATSFRECRRPGPGGGGPGGPVTVTGRRTGVVALPLPVAP
jgi:hypothetical protein